MLVVRSFFAKSVMHSFILKLLPSTVGDLANPDDISAVDQKVFHVVHRNLQKLIETFPR